ncbi:N,N-dimethylformamidase beta subunit family domain-containing protein [Kribbella sp. NPDC054772]
MRAGILAVMVSLSTILVSGCQATPKHSAAAAAGTTPGPVEISRSGSTSWVIRTSRMAGPADLAGYADHTSVRSGEPFKLFVSSSDGNFTVQSYRLGWYGGTGARLVWTSPVVRGVKQAAPALTKLRMVTTNWQPSLTVRTTGWVPGAYLLLLRAADGKEKYVPIVVRSDSARDAVLIVDAVNTEEAYNAWGGYSLYHGPHELSAQRSLEVTFDRPYDDGGARGLMDFAMPVIQQAEQSGVRLAYATSADLDADPGLLAGARGIVFGGHDEYWTPGMRNAVTKARDAGTNLAFLGANSVFWRVRYAASRLGPRRVLIGYKDARLDPLKNQPDTTVRWRSNPFPDPENNLIGMLYECFPAVGAFTIRDPGFFLFAGTGARAGTSYPGLIGDEADRAYPIAGTPADLQVVAHSPTTCGPARHTFSDASYYTAKSGAGVFTTGSIEWVRALAGPDPKAGVGPAAVAFARKVTVTVFRALAGGPLGRTHPALGDLSTLRESPSQMSGTGGPVGSMTQHPPLHARD